MAIANKSAMAGARQGAAVRHPTRSQPRLRLHRGQAIELCPDGCAMRQLGTDALKPKKAINRLAQ